VSALDVALVTFTGFPAGEDDDHLLAGALHRRGARVDFVCWDDPSIQWSTVGIAVIRSTWDYHQRVDAFLAWVDYAASVTRVVNDARTVRWNAHKGYLHDLAASGVPVVPTEIVRRGTHHELGAGDWVVKPAVSIGADRTTPHATQADLDALVATDDVLVQPYLHEVHDGEVSVVCIGGEPMHAVRKVPKQGDFRTQEHHGAAITRVSITEPQAGLAHAALAAAPSPTAFARVDLVDTSKGPLLMELELIEPTLWFEQGPDSADALADLLLKRPGGPEAPD
jgi:glutathione synthase/RimK-type ligase-like ATP-grasp enzyme